MLVGLGRGEIDQLLLGGKGLLRTHWLSWGSWCLSLLLLKLDQLVLLYLDDCRGPITALLLLDWAA